MVKGISLIIMGIGLFVSSAVSIYESYGVLFSIDEPLRSEIRTLTQAALDSFVIENEYNEAAFSLVTSLLQIKISIILLMIGGFLYFKEQKKPKQIEEKKRVSLFWQITGSLIPGFDLWVMHRIGKMKHGAIVFSIQYALFVGLFFMNVEDNLEIGISLLISIGYAYVVYSWSMKWNEQIATLETAIKKSQPSRSKLLLSISGGLFFLVFVLFSAHAVLFMGTWDELNLQEDQEGVRNAIFSEVPYLLWIDLALVGSLVFAPIFGIIGGIFWLKERNKTPQMN